MDASTTVYHLNGKAIHRKTGRPPLYVYRVTYLRTVAGYQKTVIVIAENAVDARKQASAADPTFGNTTRTPRKLRMLNSDEQSFPQKFSTTGQSDGQPLPGAFVRQYVDGCAQCANLKATIDGPRHYASTRCESGRRPHCSCDICF